MIESICRGAGCGASRVPIGAVTLVCEEVEVDFWQARALCQMTARVLPKLLLGLNAAHLVIGLTRLHTGFELTFWRQGVSKLPSDCWDDVVLSSRGLGATAIYRTSTVGAGFALVILDR